jgi:putative alpha-1,2-mannosidase
MAKPVPDSTTAWQNQAGFLHDSSAIKGMSQMHDEGTGGNPSLGNFPIWINSCTGDDWDSCPITYERRRGKRVTEPNAQVGEFGIRLDTGFDVGMAFSGRLIQI